MDGPLAYFKSMIFDSQFYIKQLFSLNAIMQKMKLPEKHPQKYHT